MPAVGSAKLFTLQETAEVLQAWSAEFEPDGSVEHLKLQYNDVVQENAQLPSAERIATICLCIVGVDMYFDLRGKTQNATEVSLRVTIFFSWCSAELRVKKKDIHCNLVERLEKLAKDRLT